jgi:hypothetical protein
MYKMGNMLANAEHSEGREESDMTESKIVG